MARKSVGEIIDGLGVKLTLNDGDLIASALLITEVSEPDGQTRVSVAYSEGMNWITRRGLIEVARDFETIDEEDDL